jgi:hypothetical protein
VKPEDAKRLDITLGGLAEAGADFVSGLKPIWWKRRHGVCWDVGERLSLKKTMLIEHYIRRDAGAVTDVSKT